MELIAYDFEIRFEQGNGQPRFVRFDLNFLGHANQERGIRSHIHPGTDDFSAPSPLMSPLEVLHILLHELRVSRKPRAL